jgi:hypothetical protein
VGGRDITVFTHTFELRIGLQREEKIGKTKE